MKNLNIFVYVLVLLVLLPVVSVKGVLPGQIIVDPNNPSWLVYNKDSNIDGKLDPFFLLGPGDPEGFLYRGARNADGTRNGDQIDIINQLKGTGANSIYFIGIRSHGGDGAFDENPFNDPED